MALQCYSGRIGLDNPIWIGYLEEKKENLLWIKYVVAYRQATMDILTSMPGRKLYCQIVCMEEAGTDRRR